MSDLYIDAETVRSAADQLEQAADMLPTGVPVDASGCGSPAVIAAVENFNMWAKVTLMLTAGKLAAQAASADASATEFERIEAEIAANASGDTP